MASTQHTTYQTHAKPSAHTLPRASGVKEALALRKIFRKRKPTFTPQDMHKKPRVKAAWRKPVGLHSKMRLRLKHHKRVVKVGYKAPALVRGYHASGVFPQIVANLTDVSSLKSGEGAIISRTTGTRMKLAIIESLQKKGIPILNFNADKFTKGVAEQAEAKKQLLAARQAKKEATKKASSAEAKKKEKQESREKREADAAPEAAQEAAAEEKKAQEKKDKDDALIHTT